MVVHMLLSQSGQLSLQMLGPNSWQQTGFDISHQQGQAGAVAEKQLLSSKARRSLLLLFGEALRTPAESVLRYATLSPTALTLVSYTWIR